MYRLLLTALLIIGISGCANLRQRAEKGDDWAQNRIGWKYMMGDGIPKDYELAREWLLKAAAQGNADSQCSLGYMCEGGYGVPQDYETARAWYEKAAAQGQATAQDNLGLLYWHGKGVPADYAKAREWFEKAAAHGKISAEYNIGAMHQRGEGFPKDSGIAKDWYEKAAVKGDPDTQFMLGYFYATGEGVAKDMKLAKQWYEKAAGQGYAQAECGQGDLCRKGDGVSKDPKSAWYWYVKSADDGYSEAFCMLGDMCRTGDGVAKDPKAAKENYESGAIRGNSDCQCNLGHMYWKGLGVPKDEKLAKEWFEKSASQGNLHAQYNLGCMYQKGEGVSVGKKMAREWWDKSRPQAKKEAVAGNCDAQFVLGDMYYNGYGVSKDRDRAKDWYEKAAANGSDWAQDKLAEAFPQKPPYSDHELASMFRQGSDSRTAASVQLLKMGRAAAVYRPVLKTLLSDPDEKVRLAAARALVWGGSTGDLPACVAVSNEALSNSVEAMRMGAAFILGQVIVDNMATTPLQSSEKVSSVKTADFPKIKINYDRLRDLYIKCLHDPNHDIRADAALYLGYMPAKDRPQVVPVLMDALKDETIQGYAMQGLGAIGPDARAAIPELLKILKDRKDEDVAVAVGRAIGDIGPETKEQLLALLDCMFVRKATPLLIFHYDMYTWNYGINDAISKLETKFIPDLTALLKDKNRNRRVEGMTAVGLLKISGEIPALIEALQDGDEQERIVAAWSLGNIGGGKDVESALRKATCDSSELVRKEARKALANVTLKKPAAPSERALDSAANHSSESVEPSANAQHQSAAESDLSGTAKSLSEEKDYLCQETKSGEKIYTLGIFDAGFVAYVNYEMIADKSWAGLAVSDSLMAAGFLFSPLTYPLRTVTGWQEYLMGSGLLMMFGYPIYGIINGYRTGDEGQRIRGWAGCGVIAILALHSEIQDRMDNTVKNTAPTPVEIGFLPAAKGAGGMMVGSWLF